MNILTSALMIIFICAGSCITAAKPVDRISTDGAYITVNGKKTILVGDSVTQGWMELGANFDYRAYIDALARNGCNVVMLWSYIGITDQTADRRVKYNAPEIWPWKKNGSQFDLRVPDRSYFNRLSDLVRYAKGNGLSVIITIHDGWTKTRFSGHPFNKILGGPLSDRNQYIDLHDYNSEMPESFDSSWTWQQKNQFYQEQYCRWLLDATSGYGNVIYEIFNEGEWYDSKKLDMYQAHFLQFIKKRTELLTMINDRPKLKGNRNCDIYSLHFPNWDRETNSDVSFRLFEREIKNKPIKPLFFSEPVPEYGGESDCETALMRLMWGTVLAGSSFVVQNDCSFAFDPNSGMSNFKKQRDYMYKIEGNCAGFLKNLNLNDMAPNGRLASSSACLASPGREYAVYTQNQKVSIDLSSLDGYARYRFYDPVTGEYSRWKICRSGMVTDFDTGTESDRIIQIRQIY